MKNMKFISYLIIIFLCIRANANVVGTDAQNFNSISSGLDFVTVQSSETLSPGVFNLGLFFNYAKNTLPYFNSGKENDSLLIADMNVGYGLTKNWDFGLSFPYLINQTVKSTATGASLIDKGITEYRFNTKYRLMGNNQRGLAVVGTVNFNRIENNPFVGVGAGPTYDLELAADTTYKKIAVGLNAGYRIRNPGTQNTSIPEIAPFKNQWIASFATSYYLTSLNLKLIGEIFGSWPAEKTSLNTQRELSSLEWLAGVKYNATESLAIHVGGGTELIQGSATPDWRVYTGMNWTFGPLFQKERPINPITHKLESSPIYKVTRDKNEDVVSIEEDNLQGPIADEESFMVRDILFEFNSDQLDDRSLETLDKFATYLKRPPELEQVIIEGHTDSIGGDRYNLELSKKRAISVGKYLVDNHKIPLSKIRAIGYGETRPIADNGNFQGREQNRRVEFKVSRKNSSGVETTNTVHGSNMKFEKEKPAAKKVIPKKPVSKPVKKQPAKQPKKTSRRR
jgi:outer membrane protein OmpA-like peptidoglycan-associated protein